MDRRVREAWARTRVRVWPERYVLAGLPTGRLAEAAALAGESGAGFAALVLEAEEVSLTLEEGRWEASGLAGEGLARSGPYRAITLDAELGLDLCGYLAPAAVRLAEAGVPLVPQCGRRTDHLLVREEDLQAALRVLEGLARGPAPED
jgi:hypothetical protein